MINASASGIRSFSDFDYASIKSPFVSYNFHATGAQTELGGSGPDLGEVNTAPALGNGGLLDFASDTYYINASANDVLDSVFNMQNWAATGSFILCCNLQLVASPSVNLQLLTYGILTSASGWGIAISATSNKIRLEGRGEGASAIVTSQNWIPSPLTNGAEISLAIEIYKDGANTIAASAFQNGVNVGGDTGFDIVSDGTDFPNNGAGDKKLVVGARRTGASTFSNYLGTDANVMMSNFFAMYMHERDTSIPSALSTFFKKYKGEPPRILEGV